MANEIGHLEHSENCYDDDILGENLFYCGGMEPTGASVSKNWYGENKNHNFSGDWKKGTGHFTQMVWKETKEVGFGKYKNKTNTTIFNYNQINNIRENLIKTFINVNNTKNNTTKKTSTNKPVFYL